MDFVKRDEGGRRFGGFKPSSQGDKSVNVGPSVERKVGVNVGEVKRETKDLGVKPKVGNIGVKPKVNLKRVRKKFGTKSKEYKEIKEGKLNKEERAQEGEEGKENLENEYKETNQNEKKETEKVPRFEYGVDKIWLDGRVEAALDQSVPQIEADSAWEQGYTGEGVKVAVLDTGIDSEHPDIAGQIDDAVSFVPGEEVKDVNGHGTHVASTVLGTGAGDGKHKGVAPDARLLVGKVLSDQGYGQDSWIIDGMEWASENAKIVNMSLGSDMPSDGTDPMAEAVNRLTDENGTLFVIAAGNRGGEGTIGSPGAADAALTVGAVDKADELAYFSSKGPRYGDMGLKPDLSAPGVGIVAARSQYSSGTGYYKSLDGTSMATPHVAGAAAILAEKYPEWDGTTLKQALMNTTKKMQGISHYGKHILKKMAT